MKRTDIQINEKRIAEKQMIFTSIKNLVFQAFNSNGFLALNKSLVKKYGPNKAIIICNYIEKYQYFENKKGVDFDGWFFLRHKDIIEEYNIGEHIIRSVKKELEETGLIKYKWKGVPAKQWITIDFYVLIEEVLGLGVKNLQGLGIENLQGLYNNIKDIIKIKEKEKSINKTGLKNSTLFFDSELKQLGLNKSSDFYRPMLRWLKYKKQEKGHKYKTIRSLKQCYTNLLKLSNNDPHKANEIVDTSIANNWSGLFPIKNIKPNSNNNRKTSIEEIKSPEKFIKQKIPDHKSNQYQLLEAFNMLENGNSQSIVGIYNLFKQLEERGDPDTAFIKEYVWWLNKNNWIKDVNNVFNIESKIFQKFVAEYEEDGY